MFWAIGHGHSAVTESALYSSVYQRILESDVRPSAGPSRENSAISKSAELRRLTCSSNLLFATVKHKTAYSKRG